MRVKEREVSGEMMGDGDGRSGVGKESCVRHDEHHRGLSGVERRGKEQCWILETTGLDSIVSDGRRRHLCSYSTWKVLSHEI